MLYQIEVNGTAWKDSDGNGQWSIHEADALADHLEEQGYCQQADVVPVPGTEDVIGLTEGPDGVWALAQPGFTIHTTEGTKAS